MAEFTPITPGGGGHPARGGLKMNKKTILLYGGIGVGAFVFINALMSGGRQSQEAGGTVPDGLPSNSADVQAQMQNFQSIMEGQLQSGLNQFANEMYSDNLAYQNDLKFLLEENKREYEKQIEELKGRQSGLTPQYDNYAPAVEPPGNVAWTVGLGLGQGTPAGQKPKPSAGLAAIQSGDKAALQAEMERAASVIEYRKSQGMDTSLQEKYLTSLQKGGKK